jgi:hypothetical protein
LVTECLYDFSLRVRRFFDDPLGLAGRTGPAKAGMQAVHLLHGSGSRDRDLGALETNFNEAQIGKGDDTGQNVATDLAIGPMAHRHYTDEIIIFAVAKSVFHHIAIKTGPDNFIGGPTEVIGDDDVFPEPLEVFSNSVVVLAKEQLPLVLMLFDQELVEIPGKMEAHAGIVVVAFDPFGIGPVGLLGLNLVTQVDKDLLEAVWRPFWGCG